MKLFVALLVGGLLAAPLPTLAETKNINSGENSGDSNRIVLDDVISNGPTTTDNSNQDNSEGNNRDNVTSNNGVGESVTVGGGSSSSSAQGGSSSAQGGSSSAQGGSVSDSGNSSNTNRNNTSSNSGGNDINNSNTYIDMPETAIAPIPGSGTPGQIGDIIVPLPSISAGAFASGADYGNAYGENSNTRSDYGVTIGINIPLGAAPFREAAENEIARREQRHQEAADRAQFRLIQEAVFLRNNGLLNAEAHPRHYAALYGTTNP